MNPELMAIIDRIWQATHDCYVGYEDDAGGQTCEGTGREPKCQTCRIAPVPYGWHGDDGYIHCPHCHQRQHDIARCPCHATGLRWPSACEASCHACQENYRVPY